MKILLIEHNPDHVLLTKRILKGAGEGYQLDSVGEAKEGLKRIIEENYDLILCDYRMPDLSALDILKKIKEKGQDLPFIVVTAAGSEKIAVELLKQGAYDYVVKDSSYQDTLPVVIKKSIETYNAQKEKKRAEQALEEAYRNLKETQDQLIQSSKMAAMGQLAAGISHELNQPLTGIKGFIQAILMDLDKESPVPVEERLVREDLKKIEEQADRMDRIIKNIRFFAKRSKFRQQRLDINRPIEDSLMLLSEQLRIHNIRLKKSLAENLPRIKGDPNQLQQVFLNLTTNARDAIDSLNKADGGELFIKSSLSKNRKNIEVIFRDTGCGIPKENLKNIFNPFFTTKSSDKSIGLGLSIAYHIIETHKGSIEAQSVEGKGSTFKITLPLKKSPIKSKEKN